MPERVVHRVGDLTALGRHLQEAVPETEDGVETHVRHILGKLGIGETPDYHRRVPAVLTYLRS